MAFTTLFLILGLTGHIYGYSTHTGGLTDVLLRQMVDRMGNDLADSESGYLNVPGRGLVESTFPERRPISSRDMKESIMGHVDYDDIIPINPSLRDAEYVSHSTLLGSMLNHYMPSDSKVRLKSMATATKPFESKTEGVLPAYCNPPNPCPVGYTKADGCLESFRNTASFSRKYQSVQDCMCDTEHMFGCQDSTRDSEITALARSIQNEGVFDDPLDKLLDCLSPKDHRTINKKYHPSENPNPYLQGERLPIAAKKGLV